MKNKKIFALVGMIAFLAHGILEAQEDEPAADDSEIVEDISEEEEEAEIEEGADESWDSYDEFSNQPESSRGLRVESIVEPKTDYHYASFGHGDPFVPPLLEDRIEVDSEIPLVSVLQKHSLQSLNVVGIWQVQGGARKALVMTESEGVVVKTDDVIGQRGGRVHKIESDALIVREFVVARDGTRQFEDTIIYLDESLSQEGSKLVIDLEEAEAFEAEEQAKKAQEQVKVQGEQTNQ